MKRLVQPVIGHDGLCGPKAQEERMIGRFEGKVASQSRSNLSVQEDQAN